MTDTVFTDAIQGDPDICNHCFRRVKTRFPLKYINHKGRVQRIRKSVLRIASDHIEYDRSVIWAPGDGISGIVPYCACGFERPGFVTLRPLSKSQFLEYGEHLAERLREKNVDFDESTYFDYLESSKSDPSKQFADDRLYDEAINAAIASF